MDDTEYVTVAGLIQFDPRDRTANNTPVRDIAIRAIGSNKIINVTVWPENAHIPLAKGDFVVADGKFTVRSYQAASGEQKTGYNVSANTLIKLSGSTTTNTPQTAPAAKADTATSVDDFPF